MTIMRLTVLRHSLIIAGMSVLWGGCIPEPQLEYPTPPLDFAQHMNEVIPRVDAESHQPMSADFSRPDMSSIPDLDLDDSMPIIEFSEFGPPDLGPPVLRTQSLHFVGSPMQRDSSGSATVYGYFGWWGTTSNRGR